jgi:hypothetical protein
MSGHMARFAPNLPPHDFLIIFRPGTSPESGFVLVNGGDILHIINPEAGGFRAKLDTLQFP